MASRFQDFDLIFEVKQLQSLNCQEISRLLKENENFSLMHISENGSILQVDVDKLVRFLPLHLTAMVLSTKKDEAMLRYLLSGLRLLHSFCEIASRHPKLEQILLDDVRVSEQLLDMVFLILIICSAYKQGNHFSGAMPLLYAAIVACSMYLLTACISSQWNELAFVLHCHPKVDIFIDVAFGAVRRNFNFIQTIHSADDYTRYSNPSLAVERAVYFHCQQCEASLQFLQQMCQNKSFQERFLKNKELCGKGGVLRLVKAALNLNTPLILEGSCAVIAALSRIKARVLSILLYLCEAESVSYLDEVASIPESLDLAKSVALEVVELLKTTLTNESKRPQNYSGKTYPMGLLQLNALRLADIFSDDSNLRSYITIYFAEVLAAVLSIPYQQFLSSWCSSDLLLKEEDVSLDYEPFTMAGWVLDLSSPLDICNVEICESNFIPIGSTQASYAHQRTSLLVKVIANLHCFVPNICKEQERNLFLHKFLDCLNIEWQDPHAGDSFPSQSWPGVAFSSALQIAANVCKNLRSLLGHAESLIPTFLNEEDVQLFRVFFTQVQSLIGPVDLEVNRAWELNNTRDSSSPLHGGKELDPKFSSIILREGMSENSAFPGVGNPDVNQVLVGEADGVMQGVNRCEVKSSKNSLERVAEVENAETSGSDLSSSRGKNKNLVGQVGNGEATKSFENSHKSNIQGSQEDERVETLNCEEKPIRKRKRHIMNDKQASLFERAVQEEPDIHKNAALLHEWAVSLSCHGSEVTSAQLKNWLNNRKAKLLRAAAKDSRLSSEDSLICDKQDGSKSRPLSELPQGLKEDTNQITTAVSCIRPNMSHNVEIAPESSAQLNPQNLQVSNTNSARLMAGQAVTLTDPQGKEIAKGKLFQVEGEWLNNRKAKLLRAAAKDGRLSSEDSLICDKQDGSKQRPLSELPQGLKEDTNQITTAVTCIRPNMSHNVEIAPESSTQLNPQNLQVSNTNSARLMAGQAVTLTDPQGKEIAKGKLFQVEGEWLNNRKAKLLRAAAKDGRLSSEDSLICDKQDGSKSRPLSELPQGLKEDTNQITTAVTCIRPNMSHNVEIAPESSAQLNPQNLQVSNTNGARLMAGQAVTLTDPQGKEIAKGTVFQVEGEWHGCNLAETSTCVVDITELKSDRIVRLPHPSIEGGATFEQAEVKVGNMRVLWDFGRIRTR